MKRRPVKEIPISLNKITRVIRDASSPEEARDLLVEKYGMDPQEAWNILCAPYDEILKAKVRVILN